MLAIKLYTDDEVRVHTCTSYARNREHPIIIRPIYPLGVVGDPEIVVLPGDEVYIENANGKTIDIIRPER